MDKIDFKKDLKHLYQPSGKVISVVDVPPINFLMVDGHGDPNNNPDYQAVVEALYAMSYALKFALKPQGIEYVVAPLEGLWWVEKMEEFSTERKDEWDWTMMIRQPEQITAELVEKTAAQVGRKKDLPALSRVRLGTYHEGLSVQILYTGAYADEGPTVARLHAFIKENGYQTNGKHHEIYLGDTRKTSPEKLKTVIRQPVKKG